MALSYDGGGSDEAFHLWDEWSRRSGKYDDAKQQSSWDSFRHQGDKSKLVRLGSLFHMAMQHGWNPKLEAFGEIQPMPQTAVATLPAQQPVQQLSPFGQWVMSVGATFAQGYHEEMKRRGPIVPHEGKAQALVPMPTEHGFKWAHDDTDGGVDWLVDDLMMLKGWGFLSGTTGTFKTFLLIHLSLCLAAKRDFFGRKIMQPGGSCFVAAEAAYSMRDRIKAGAKYGFPRLGQLPIAYQGSPPNLLQPAVLAAFIERLRLLSAEMMKTHGMPLRMVCFDTFAKSFGLNEDKAHESVAAHNVMEKIAETLNVAVVAVGHFGKDPLKGTRGSSSHDSNAHFVFTIPKHGELFVKKVKEAPQGITFGRFDTVLIDLGTVDKHGKPVTSLAVRELNATSAFEEVPEGAEPADAAESRKRSVSVIKAAITQALEKNGEDATHPNGKRSRRVRLRDVRQEFCCLWGKTKHASTQTFRINVLHVPGAAPIEQDGEHWIYDPGVDHRVLQ